MADRVDMTVGPDGVAWIILDNPTKLNAVSVRMWQDLSAVLTRAEHDPAVRCVVLAGAGDKAFCVGADLSHGSYTSGPEALQEYDRIVKGALNQLQAFPKPTLAMVQGFCIGAGIALAAACDIRVAADTARFAVPVAKLGISYVYEGVVRLVALMGPAQAKRLLYTAEKFPAADMLQAGLVEEVVAAGELASRVRALAAAIAANAPLSNAASKYAVETICRGASAHEIAAYADRARACMESEDHAEGQRAFREKRAPVFSGQ